MRLKILRLSDGSVSCTSVSLFSTLFRFLTIDAGQRMYLQAFLRLDVACIHWIHLDTAQQIYHVIDTVVHGQSRCVTSGIEF